MPDPQSWLDNEQTLLHYQQTMAAEIEPAQLLTLLRELVIAGSVLVVSFASANRDETVCADAATFDPDREALGQHLAFGLGMHACIGNPLARMEVVIATQVLAQHVESLAVQRPEDLRYNASFMVRGLQPLPAIVRRLR